MARLAGRLLAFGGDADFFSDYQDSELQNGKCLTQIKFLQLFPFKFYLSLPILLHFATLPRPRNGTPWQPDWLNRGMGSGGGKVNINEIFTNLSLSQYLTFETTVYQREYINPCNVSHEFSRKQNSFSQVVDQRHKVGGSQGCIWIYCEMLTIAIIISQWQ